MAQRVPYSSARIRGRKVPQPVLSISLSSSVSARTFFQLLSRHRRVDIAISTGNSERSENHQRLLNQAVVRMAIDPINPDFRGDLPNSRSRLMRRRFGTATSLPTQYRYHAFISYSHAADGQLAPALQRGLHNFAKPWYRVRALSIFRDNESLSASPHLWTSIQDALDVSEFFILLASPTGAQSPWVEREADRWCATKPKENLLIALTEGELFWDPVLNDFDWQRTNALPVSLRGAFDEEPRFVDLRWARSSDELDLTHPRFSDAVADLAAPLHHRLKADIASEEVRQHKHTIRVARRVAVSLVVLTVAAVIAGVIAINARGTAITQKTSAQSSSLSARSSSELTDNFDVAGLLGAQAYSLDATDESRSQVVTTLEQPTTAILRGHSRQVNGVSFDRSGDLIASVGQDGTLRLWDVANRREVGSPRDLIGDVPAYGTATSESGSATAVAFSPASQLLVTAAVIYHFSGGGIGLASETSTLSVWMANGHTLQRVAERSDPGREIRNIAFNPEGTELATASDDGSVQLWSPSSLSLLATPAPSGEAPQPSTVSFSPDGKLLAFDANSEVQLWDIATNQPTGLPISPNAGAISFDPANAAVLATAGSSDVELWDIAANQELSSYKVSLTSGAHDIVFSPDGGRIGVAVADQTPAFLLDIGTNFQLGPVEVVPGASDRVYQIGFNGASSQIVTANEDGTVRVFTVPGLSGLAQVLPRSVFRSEMGVGDDTVAAINSAAGGEADLWNLKTGGEQRVPIGFVASTMTGSIAVSSGGAQFAVADDEGGIHVLNGATGRQVGAAIDANGAPVALSSTGLIAAPVRGGSMALFESSEAHHRVATLIGSNRYGTPTAAAFSPDGRLLAVSFLISGQTFSNRIALWNAVTHQAVGHPLVTSGPIFQLAFSPDDTLFGTSSNSGKVQLWNVSDQSQVAVLADDQSNGVSGIAFSPNGSTVAAVVGCSLELWDPASQSAIGSPIDLHYVVSHGNPDTSCGDLHVELGFGASGALVVNLGFAGPVYVWSPLLTNTSSSIFRSTICSIVGRSLSPAEYSQALPGEPYRGSCSGPLP